MLVGFKVILRERNVIYLFAGAMAGLAFAMIVAGVLIAAGIYFALLKLRKVPDSMAVSFVKSETDA